MSPRARSAAALIALAVTSGCGGRGKDDSGDGYASRYARAVCAEIRPCCGENGLSFDKEQCVLGGAGYVQSGVDRAFALGATLDPAAAEACISGAARLAGTCRAVADDPEVAAACAHVFVGPKSPGESCTESSECEGTATLHGECELLGGADGGASRGLCVRTRPGGAPGDRCRADEAASLFEVSACSTRGLYCNALSGECAVRVELGGACGLLLPCVEGSYCAESVCAETLPSGSPCTSDTACRSRLCQQGMCAVNGVGGLAPCTGNTG